MGSSPIALTNKIKLLVHFGQNEKSSGKHPVSRPEISGKQSKTQCSAQRRIWGKSTMKSSGVVLAAACVAMLTTTGHAQQDNPYSANEVMKGCRAFIARTQSEGFSDAFLRGICLGSVHTLSGTARSLEAGGVTFGICCHQ